MKKEETLKSIKTIQDFAEFYENENSLTNDDIETIIEAKGWYDLTFEDCLDEECTLHSVCSDGQYIVIYNNKTGKVLVKPDKELREKPKNLTPFHREKETNVYFKSIKGHDICVKVKRVCEPGNDKSFIEMSIDGGSFYKNVGASNYDDQVYYMVYDKEQDKTLRVIMPDEVYFKIMFLRAEKIVKTNGCFNDALLAKVKEYIANGWVLPKAEIKKATDEANMKNVFFFWNNYESEMSSKEVFNILEGVYARGLNNNYRGYMIAEYVDIIKKIYPDEF